MSQNKQDYVQKQPNTQQIYSLLTIFTSFHKNILSI